MKIRIEREVLTDKTVNYFLLVEGVDIVELRAKCNHCSQYCYGINKVQLPLEISSLSGVRSVTIDVSIHTRSKFPHLYTDEKLTFRI